ncbi:MAG: hypothetical protein Q8P67_16765 [archaeon]|nr:hypothetical protein [archaeon]
MINADLIGREEDEEVWVEGGGREDVSSADHQLEQPSRDVELFGVLAPAEKTKTGCSPGDRGG